jgi:hypothetical protein
MVTTTAITRYPWQPESTKTALRAIGDLGVGLMNALKTQRDVHPESLLTVATHFTRLLATGCRNGGWAPPGLRKASRSHAFDSPMPGECRVSRMRRTPIHGSIGSPQRSRSGASRNRTARPTEKISRLIGMTKETLSARIGVALIMESAVITSKIDPETIEPGKWRIDTGEGALPITRLRK